MWCSQEDDPGGAAIDCAARQILSVIEVFGGSDERLHGGASISSGMGHDGMA